MINYSILFFIGIIFIISRISSILYLLFFLDIGTIYNLLFLILQGAILFIFVFVFVWIFLSKNKLNITIRQILGEEESKILHFSKSFVVTFDKDENIYWTSYNNHELSKFLYKKKVKEIIPDFDQRTWGKKRLEIVKILNDHYEVRFLKDSNVILFKNINDINALQNKIIDDEVVFGYIKIDDLPHLLESESNFKDYEILSIVAESLKKWFKNTDSYFKNIGRDLFFFITTKKRLNNFKENKFNILEKIKNVGNKNNLPLSLSIGIGVGLVSKNNLNDLANEALKKAESRSGDQVVINDFGKPLEFFGGRTETGQKSIKNNIRKFSQKLVQEIKKAKKIVVMGHKFIDFDALASSLALVCLAKGLSDRPDIRLALDMKNIDSKTKEYLDKFLGEKYIRGNIVSLKEAKSLVDEETLIIVVDTYNPKRVEFPSLLEKTKKIIVLDHHRQSDEVIENTHLKFIDADASSTSEIIVEIIELTNNKNLLSKKEINLLYTGIILDTKNFNSSKLSFNTFKSASLLKYWNANHLQAIEFLKKTQKEISFIYDKINKAIKIKDGVHFIIIDDQRIDTTLLAQIGDAFMNISEVKSIFVFGLNKNNDFLVSSRSNGKINVQVIMEHYNGGGHYSAAATKVLSNEYDSLESFSDDIKKYIIENKIGD